jgi:predicted molibdopterin-dependent oxidoreductase YjgC
MLAPDAYLAMHPLDAAQLGLCDGTLVDVESDHGCVRTTLRLQGGNALRRGVVYMPFHFTESPANRLVGGALDPTAKIPGLKETAVSVTAV